MSDHIHNEGGALSEPDELAEQEKESRSGNESSAPASVNFPVVGVGASAGGVSAFEKFVRRLGGETGMAFVLVQHLDPERESELTEILQAASEMTVVQAGEGQELQPDHVYITPPGKELLLQEATLRLAPLASRQDSTRTIDRFFNSLAETLREQAVCVVLSGTGDDGCRGLKYVKELGGLTMVQDPDDAEYAEMPRQAADTGVADVVAPVEQLAEALLAYQKQPAADLLQAEATDEQEEYLYELFGELRSRTGYDFSQYKRSTILRRLQRRMRLNQMRDFPTYLDFLQSSHDEARALVKDFLISVTSFFRDAKAFDVLRDDVIPQLFEEKEAGQTLRIWVPGCATGEEAYTLAILLAEEARRHQKDVGIQIFATDIDEAALAVARRGLYPPSIAADLSTRRLNEFFTSSPSGYHVNREVQNTVLFAHHNLLKDPPFSRLDIISCRNLLIYLRRDIQQQLFELFHYALNPPGYLFLGSSETVTRSNTLFKVMNKEYRVYERRPGPLVLPRLVSASTREGTETVAREKDETTPVMASADVPALSDVHRDVLLREYTPPSVVVNRDYAIRHLVGNVGRYLRPPDGRPTYSLLEMAPKSLKLELRSILFQVFRKGQPASANALPVDIDGQKGWLRLSAQPFPAQRTDEELALVVLEEAPQPEKDAAIAGGDEKQEEIIKQLEDEVQDARHQLQTVIEEYETSNEELKVSNEELQSTNEELHSTAEELQTREEELQSTNKELSTLNEELRAKIDELNRVNSDLENLIEATSIATIFLDRDLQLKRYTPRATELFNLIPSDIGRPFAHISHDLRHERLPENAERVLTNLESLETEVQSQDGRWFQMRVLPYRTVDNRIDGVVLTFVEITKRLQAEAAATTRARQQAVVAELGHMALRGAGLSELMDVAVRQVAQVLDVEMCKVLELRADGSELLVKVGVGFREGYVGQTMFDTSVSSQAGYTLEVGGPVISEDLAQERRFSPQNILTDHNVAGSMTVVIEGRRRPYGVLGAHTTERRAFSELDAAFLHAVAHVLASTVEWQRSDRERSVLLARVEAERAHLHNLFMQAPGFITMRRGPQHVYTFSNEFHQRIVGDIDLIGKTPEEAFPDLDTTPIVQALDRVYESRERMVQQELRVEFDRDGDGELEEAYFDVVHQPILEADDSIEGVMTFAFEVTERVRARQALEQERRRLKELAQTLEDRVNERTAQVRSLASALSLAEQRERERISQVLHDDLQQQLHALHVQMVMLQSEPEVAEITHLRETIEEVNDLIGSALDVTRALTVEMSPPILRGEGLGAALAWLASHVEEVYGLKVNLAVQEPPMLRGKDLRELVFQLVRELLFNVVKHAQVDEATLTVYDQDGQLAVRVEDAGIGFEPEDVLAEQDQGGFGLHSIQRRLNLFGGEMEIDAEHGNGTRVTLVMPPALNKE